MTEENMLGLSPVFKCKCQEILEWLRERNQLNDLKSALDYIERENLVNLIE